MPLADTLPGAPPKTTPIPGRQAKVHGWGGSTVAPVTLFEPAALGQVQELIASRSELLHRGAIPRGMGRSYGDAAQLRHGAVIEMTGCKHTELDAERGVLTAQAGVTLGELLAEIGPRGFVVSVVPGTQHVTVGGAIASDIHGKNHGSAGTFGSYVEALGLLTASGEVLELEPGAPDRLFEATLGGMGLTGVILWARMRLRRVESSLVSVDTDRVADLDSALAVLSSPGGSHRVAWLDMLGPRATRGVVTRAEHAPAGAGAGSATVASRVTAPARFPGGVLRSSTIGPFNELRFRLAPRRERGRLENFGTHMFPLDALDLWPRLYGSKGFVQYQLVVPLERYRTMHDVIACLDVHRVPCFLAVLKDFGPANDAPISFPMTGWTLALDLPRAAPNIGPALTRCDELVAEAGGRVYLTKDLRMAPDALAAMYPRLGEWRAIRDGVDPDGLWRSDLAMRTGMVAA